MRTARDELIRRQNLWWKVAEAIATEARIAAMLSQDDIDKALRASDDEEMARLFSHFAGSRARDAFTLAALALEYKEKARGNG